MRRQIEEQDFDARLGSKIGKDRLANNREDFFGQLRVSAANAEQ